MIWSALRRTTRCVLFLTSSYTRGRAEVSGAAKHRNLGSLPGGLGRTRLSLRRESEIMDNLGKGYHQDYSPYRLLASSVQIVYTIEMRVPFLPKALEAAMALSETGPGEEGALVCFMWGGKLVRVAKRSDLALLHDTTMLTRTSEVGPYPLWLTFNDTLAKTFPPKADVVNYARLVPKPEGERTVIKAEWGEEQTLVGPYFEVYNPTSGETKYRSAFNEWVTTNTQLEGDQWYESAPVRAYPSPTEGWVETILADGTKETSKYVHVGDYLVQRQTGEVRCLDAQEFPARYDISFAH